VLAISEARGPEAAQITVDMPNGPPAAILLCG